MRSFSPTVLLFCLFSLMWQGVAAQYPKGYFRNPLGIPMQLAANFGEVRTNHFHMGFDLRTNQKENLPVYAAAEGYISRVTIEAGGYGRAIYITHPNGYITVYAHLNDFYPALQRFVMQKQYAEEKWEQSISFGKDEFKVSKGQFIAYSGNTGSSQGPHLHFEIRDNKTGNNINPRLFGFPIADKLQPFIYSLFVYDRNYSTYALDAREVKIKGTRGLYTTREKEVVTGSGKISFGISAEDIGNTSSFRFGIYSAELWLDGVRQIIFYLDELNYEDSRYMNGAIDYRKRINDGSLIQHLSRLPGNKLSIYEGISDGVIQLQDTLPHQVRIIVKDVDGNASFLEFMLRWKPELYDAPVFTQQTVKMLPNISNRLVRDEANLEFATTAFYDTVPFFFAATGTAQQPAYQLHYASVPVHDAYRFWIRSNRSDDPKLIWRLNTGRSVLTRRVQQEGGGILSGSFDKLGMLSLVRDTIPPMSEPAGWKDGGVFAKSGTIAVNVRDDLSQVTSFRAELDGQWLMFARKGNSFYYKIDERCALGPHTLLVRIQDQAGNITERTLQFELKERIVVNKKSKKPVKRKKR